MVKLVIQNEITIGQLVVFSHLALLAWPTAAFSWIINIIQRGIASLARIQAIMDKPSHPQFNHPNSTPLKKAPTIEVKNLQFAYTKESPTILDGISFQIDAGQRLGIFGASGTGKTTLANINCQIEPAPPGCLFFDGQDVTQSNVNAYRDGIASVPQRRFLFSSSILSNVAFSDPSMPISCAEDAAKRACVMDDILAFPNDWETLVGEKGVVLSGGQQHRLAMARAYASCIMF